MQVSLLVSIIIILIGFLLGTAGWVLGLHKKIKEKEKDLLKEKQEITRRLYESSILKEIGERTGYSLNVEEIMQIITGSLRQFIDYTAVSYFVIYPEKIKFNIHFEQSVAKDFLAEMKKRMAASLEALMDKKVDLDAMEEIVSGAIFVESLSSDIGSFFNIPLVIGGKLAGLLTIAHTSAGLYKEEDMTILYKITNQASMAVTRLQEVVAAEQVKLNAMVESMGDGVVMVDAEYRVIVANPAIKKIVNLTKPEITIFDFVDFLGGKFDIHGKLEKALSQGDVCVSDRIELGKNFFEVVVCPVKHKTPKGEEVTYGAVTVFHDITKDIQIEKLKEDFTSMIVHELRSPLDGMKKIIELVVSGTIKKSSPKFNEYISMVYQSCASMLELVNDILDYSKLSAGKFEIHERPSNIKDIVNDRIMFYGPLASTKKVELSGYIGEGLQDNFILDDHALKQVINNFISNALKFTGESGRIRLVSFLFDPEQGIPKEAAEKMDEMPCGVTVDDLKFKEKSIVVAVLDSGVGIKPEHTNQLFFTYKQLEEGFYSETKGTGLGLAIAKGIIENHKGVVGLASHEGRGSAFFFAIPARR
jgi:two-component system, NtrC family, sensor histidine kinase KinB